MLMLKSEIERQLKAIKNPTGILTNSIKISLVVIEIFEMTIF